MKAITFIKDTQTGLVTMSSTGECKENEVILKANSTDAATEKHVPVVEISDRDVKVTIGSVIHPMTEAHHIAFIVLETTEKVIQRNLEVTDAPTTVFHLNETEKPLRAYEYCNLHGLWVKNID